MVKWLRKIDWISFFVSNKNCRQANGQKKPRLESCNFHTQSTLPYGRINFILEGIIACFTIAFLVNCYFHKMHMNVYPENTRLDFNFLIIITNKTFHALLILISQAFYICAITDTRTVKLNPTSHRLYNRPPTLLDCKSRKNVKNNLVWLNSLHFSIIKPSYVIKFVVD